MQVKHFMCKDIVIASPQTSLLEVWKLISKKHAHGLPIVDKQKKLVGIVSEKDLLSKLFTDYEEVMLGVNNFSELDDDIRDKLKKFRSWTAEKVMNRTVVYVRRDTNVMRALSRMIVHKIRQLPVLDEDDQLVGVISKSDIFHGLFKRNIRTFLKKN